MVDEVVNLGWLSPVRVHRSENMKRRVRRQQIKRRREAWWWHYLPLHQGTVGGHLGPPAETAPPNSD
jgi:hypothetical protein